MSSQIGIIEPLKWSKSSTALDYDNWFKIFQCMLVINKIDLTNAGHALQAKAMLYAYGGDKIRSACELADGYATILYADLVTHLKAHFKQETTKLDALMFVATKPNPNEKLSDYAQTLKMLYKATGLPDDKCDFMCLIIIAAHAPTSEIRNKAMETTVTLKSLLEWQAMNELTEQLDSLDTGNSEITLRRARETKTSSGKQYDKASNSRKRRSESEKKRYNDQKQRMEGCYFCGEKFPHSGKCLAEGHTCNFCGNKNHMEKVCLAKRRQAKSNPNGKRNAALFIEESDSDLSCRLGKTKDACPRALITVNGLELLHILDTGANINILTRQAYDSFSIKPVLKTVLKTSIYLPHQTRSESAR